MDRKYAVISNKEKDIDNKINNLITKHLKENGCNGIVNIFIGKDELIDEKLISNIDIIFSLGGDGTFLNIARQTSKLGIPILGINLGSLGFLAEVELKDIEKSVKDIVNGKYEIQERMMITSTIYKNDKPVYQNDALNDFVISRGELSRIITLELYINNSFVDSFPGDGLIISTPTGSTGYALSAGGPVIEHDAKLMLITPICSHAMHSRSFVVDKKSNIEIKLIGDKKNKCLLTVDGQKGFSLAGDEKVVIKRSKIKAKIIKVNNKSFYDTLRKKMYVRERR